MSSKVTTFSSSRVFLKAFFLLSVLVLISLTACERRQQVYANIDETKGNPGSSESVDPHKKYE